VYVLWCSECYKELVTLKDPRRGPAYAFWDRIQDELAAQGMSQAELVRRTGIAATVITSLKTSPPRDRAARERNVTALADALGIDRTEARRLAGLVPSGDKPVDLRDAIRAQTDYNDDEKKALIGLLDVLDASKRSAGRVDKTA
jgi:transcriptional regulator with XRE-family HTH domain